MGEWKEALKEDAWEGPEGKTVQGRKVWRNQMEKEFRKNSSQRVK